MTNVTHPLKEQVRAHMQSRVGSKEPPPALEQVRTQLGWKLIEASRQAQPGRKL